MVRFCGSGPFPPSAQNDAPGPTLDAHQNEAMRIPFLGVYSFLSLFHTP